MADKKPNALQQPLTPSAQLAAVVGSGQITRGDVVSKMWAYIKKNNLQNPANKREILADDKLEARLRRQGQSQHVRDEQAPRQTLEVDPCFAADASPEVFDASGDAEPGARWVSDRRGRALIELGARQIQSTISGLALRGPAALQRQLAARRRGQCQRSATNAPPFRFLKPLPPCWPPCRNGSGDASSQQNNRRPSDLGRAFALPIDAIPRR